VLLDRVEGHNMLQPVLVLHTREMLSFREKLFTTMSSKSRSR